MISWKGYLKGECGPSEFVRDVCRVTGEVYVSSYKPHKALVLRGSRGELFIPLNGEEDKRKAKDVVYTVKMLRGDI